LASLNSSFVKIYAAFQQFLQQYFENGKRPIGRSTLIWKSIRSSYPSNQANQAIGITGRPHLQGLARNLIPGNSGGRISHGI
jgi:hypothetical protein